MSVVVEIVQLVSTVVLTCTAVAMVLLGYLGFHKWQPEAVGKRKLELAEGLMADIYRFRDTVQAARSPMTYYGFGKTADRRDGESEAVAEARRVQMEIHERLYRDPQYIPGFLASQYRARTYFGDEMAAFFGDVKGILSDVQNAASELVELAGQDEPDIDLTKQYRKDIGLTTVDDDRIGDRLDNLVVKFENFLAPILLQDRSN